MVHIYNRTEKAYTKWQEEGPEGAGVWKEDKDMEAKPWRTCALLKSYKNK